MTLGNGNGQHLVNRDGLGKTAPPQFYFSIDCDWVPGSHVGLEMLLAFCDRTHLKGTIFFAGRFAEAYPHLVRDCHDRGHQLGTHGWAHGGLEDDEDFRSASYEQQRRWIRQATDAVEKAAGIRPVVFRAPNLSIGETTLRALEHEGYRYDSSIPARRFDMGFGRVHYTEYFWAPLDPYYPSLQQMHRPGGSSILEIPPSACLFPINLAALRVLGLAVFNRMIRWIGRRSHYLVFYCHPSEFVLAEHQRFPLAMSKWNQQGMRPANLSLVDALLDSVLESGYDPVLMVETTPRPLDLREPVVLRRRSYQSDYP